LHYIEKVEQFGVGSAQEECWNVFGNVMLLLVSVDNDSLNSSSPSMSPFEKTAAHPLDAAFRMTVLFL
jgi:hypothetical protein